MKRRGSLRDDSIGSDSTMQGLLLAIFLVVLVVGFIPISMYVANGLAAASSEVAYYEPVERDDMLDENLTIDQFHEDVTWTYTNNTDVTIDTDQACYYRSQTDNTYNELLVEPSSTDDGTVDTNATMSMRFNLDKTTADLVDEDTLQVNMFMGLERNVTLDVKIVAAGIDDQGDTSTYVIKEAQDVNFTTDINDKRVVDLEFSKFLDADTQLDEYQENQTISVVLEDDDGGAFQSGDAIQWNLQLVHEETVQRDFVSNIIAVIDSIVIFVLGVFTTEKYDLKDLVR